VTEPKILTGDRAFDFLKSNERPAKPRSRGVTEIRGPYYTPMGKHYLQDILETMGAYVDVLKFAAGSFSLMPRRGVKELLDLCQPDRPARMPAFGHLGH
jgi:phosphosulfolactate synthase (CoM biosynthesis protein A)